MNFLEYAALHRAWSRKTFGPGLRTEGLLKHIESEFAEIRERPDALDEWVDIIILALDGAWRSGHTPAEIAAALEIKQTVNMSRQWPAVSEDQPSFHRKD